MQLAGEKCCTILASAFSKDVQIKLDSGENTLPIMQYLTSLLLLVNDNVIVPTVLKEKKNKVKETDDGVTGMCLECLFGTYSTYNINRSRCRQLSDSCSDHSDR